MAKVGYDDYFAKKEQGKIRKRNPAMETVLHVFIAIIVISGLFAGGWAIYNRTKPKPPVIPAIQSVFFDNVVKVYNAADAKWTKVSDPFKLNVDDLLITGKTSRTILDFQNQASIRVAPQTGIMYKQFTGKTLNLGLEQGRIWLEAWDGNYSVDTFRGSITMGPGVAQVSVNKGKSVSVHCYQGPLLITTTANEKNEVTLKSGQKIFINGKNQISSIAKIDGKQNDDWEKWNLAFSGKTMKIGMEPPPYQYKSEKKEIVIVFDSPEVKEKKPQRTIRKPRVADVADGNPPKGKTAYPKANSASYPKGQRMQPHIKNQPGGVAEGDGQMGDTSMPGYDGRMTTDSQDPPHFDANGSGGDGVPDRPDDIDSMFGENTNEDFKDKAQDATKKLSNEKMTSDESRKRKGPPGFGINDKPESEPGGEIRILY